MKSKIIALSAISSAFVAICLTLGAYIEFIDLISVAIAALFTMLPLYYESKKGSLLSFLVGGVLAFILSGANVYSLVFPAYFLYFGLIPLINYVVSKTKFDKTIWFIIKLVWCVVICYFLLFYYTNIIGIPLEYTFELFGKSFDFSNYHNIYYYFLTAYGVISIILYLVYDKFTEVMKLAIDRLLKRILR